MRSSLRFEALATRFQPFVEELRCLFAECGVTYGSPDDLPRFSEELSAGGRLRSGVRTMVRGVLRRVEDTLSHGDLVELILVAAAGTDFDEQTPAVQRAERVLSQFVGEAMTSTVAVSYTQVTITDATADENGSEEKRVSAIQAEESEEPAAVRLRPEVTVWDSPPAFVWAALICGVLLAPCMYLLSRPHGATAPPPQTRAVSPASSAFRPEPPAGLDSRAFNQIMSEIPGGLGSPVLKGKPAVRLHGREAVTPSKPDAEQGLPADVPGVGVMRGTDDSVREKDAPARDHSSPAPAPDPQRTDAPEF